MNEIDYTKRLMEAGFSRRQAETAINMAIEFSNEKFATNERIDKLEVSIDHKFEALEYRLTIKLGLMLFAAMTLQLGILKYFVL